MSSIIAGRGVITDMSTACALPALSLELGNKCEFSNQACPLAVGARVAGQAKDMSGGGAWYALDLVGGRNYSIDVQGLSDGQGTLRLPHFQVRESDPMILSSAILMKAPLHPQLQANTCCG